MDQSFPWLLIAVAAGTLGLLVVALVVFVRLRADVVPLSPEERAEWSATPLTPLQKTAWIGLAVGLLTGVLLVLVFRSGGGAAVYWEDDALRLKVVGIFITGLILQALLMAVAVARADERDRAVLRGAPQMQAVALLLGMVAWHIWLGEHFHQEGAVPMVYTYLSLGTMFMLYLLSWFAGVLIGYRLGGNHGQS